MKQNITYPLSHGLSKTGLPLIAVEMNDQNICFLLDSGATLNLLDKRVYDYFNKDKLNETKVATKISNFGIDGIETEVHRVEQNFKFENCLFKAKFSIFDSAAAFDKVEEESGIQIHGILGRQCLFELDKLINIRSLSIYAYPKITTRQIHVILADHTHVVCLDCLFFI